MTDKGGWIVREPYTIDIALTETIAQRDQIESDATELAEAVGRYFGESVGEHTSANCPIERAMELIEAAIGEPTDGNEPHPDHCLCDDCVTQRSKT